MDDCASVRESTASLLESASLTVREHANAGRILSEMAQLDGDCILTDLRMPRIDGLELLTRLRAAGCNLPVVVMTGYGDVTTAVRAMKLGAQDFIEKPFPPQALLRAVRSAIRCRRANGYDVRQAIIAWRLDRLTSRERQVLDRVLLGRTNRDIGDELAISPRTVEVFRARLMKKMECETVQDLVHAALQAGEA
ncbi:response regulator transcription factor [Methylobacterium longum]|uniref:Response regulator n=1 Tax=Methylobacterium longum TaxID=767694 RepID=A0ABT8AZ32_9HYPH|nr:response regulator [Methylobacterium longum]MDN3575106.1 response regulator [Methylobacterium longum]